MKLANPLYYPLSILAGAVVLVACVRVANLPNFMAVPLAIVVAAGGSAVQKTQERSPTLANPALERELQAVRQQAKNLTEKADHLRQEATRLLPDATQMELLATVQYACDRATELPAKIDQLAQQMQGTDSLLAVSDLQQQQLHDVEARSQRSTGVVRDQLQRLADSLNRNIQLAHQGQDARQAQVVSLSTLILDSASVLQAMQNQLRTADLQDVAQTETLRSLSEELRQFQETVDLLVTKS